MDSAEALQRLSEIDAHVVSALAQLHRTRDPVERELFLEAFAAMLPDLKRLAEEQRDREDFADPNAALLVGIRLDAIEQMASLVISERQQIEASKARRG